MSMFEVCHHSKKRQTTAILFMANLLIWHFWHSILLTEPFSDEILQTPCGPFPCGDMVMCTQISLTLPRAIYCTWTSTLRGKCRVCVLFSNKDSSFRGQWTQYQHFPRHLHLSRSRVSLLQQGNVMWWGLSLMWCETNFNRARRGEESTSPVWHLVVVFVRIYTLFVH